VKNLFIEKLSIIIEIRGIYGGLTAAFRFILPTVFRFLVKIKQRFQNQRQTEGGNRSINDYKKKRDQVILSYFLISIT
jgi:hypothetical protein